MSSSVRLSARKLLLWGAVAAPLLLALGCTVGRMRESAEMARASEPLQRPLRDPAARLLIVGDSTAVGTGASSPQASLAGLLARAYPGLHIENRGRDGATFAELAQQLDGDAPFDMVLIQAGGNDVIRLRDLDRTAVEIDHVIRRARERAEFVVVMPAGNVGNAPFFFAPVSWVMTARARRLHAQVRASALRHGAVYVNLFKEKQNDPFAQHSELNARDGLHPSDQGYRVWLDALSAQSGFEQRLAALTASSHDR
ncbi:MAG: GDSL family lipase [Gammaproteobacteria bacterium]|nr:GDSL family lipase [Gammaproteobacteria bacterium]